MSFFDTLTERQQYFLRRQEITLDVESIKYFCWHLETQFKLGRGGMITKHLIEMTREILDKVDEYEFTQALEAELTK
jgi:hypothetical protein